MLEAEDGFVKRVISAMQKKLVGALCATEEGMPAQMIQLR